MARRTGWTFRAEATFVATRALTLAGRDYQADQLIDPTGLSTPRLRQLYAMRRIRPLLEQTLTANPEEPDDAEPLPDRPRPSLDLDAQPLPVRRRRPRS